VKGAAVVAAVVATMVLPSLSSWV